MIIRCITRNSVTDLADDLPDGGNVSSEPISEKPLPPKEPSERGRLNVTEPSNLIPTTAQEWRHTGKDEWKDDHEPGYRNVRIAKKGTLRSLGLV